MSNARPLGHSRPVSRRLALPAGLILLLAVVAAPPALAADVTNPGEVTGLWLEKQGGDIALVWDAVVLDAAGQPETVDYYRVFRGTSPDFVPDKAGGSNEIGTSVTSALTDPGAVVTPDNYFYLVTAVDLEGNESLSKASTVSTPPALTGFWTDSTIELDWIHAEPHGEVANYRIYWGPGSGQYEGSDLVGPDVTSYSLNVPAGINYYTAVAAIDLNGNESAFSNEHVDVVGGVITVRAQDGSELCWGASKCTPTGDEVQRSNGWQLMVPVDFPEGDWTNVELTWTIESRLCEPPAGGNVDRCIGGNPCVNPPCNGGYNTCGDPWDRTAHLFMVLDDCIEGTGSCMTNENLELMRAITPFGTDADPPDGRGTVPPRVLTLDITPYVPLLTGRKYIGTHIGHFVQTGWWTTVDFRFSKRPDDVTDKLPADGLQILFFGGANPPTATLSVPAEAQEVYTRLFTTGHGGNLRCDGGSNNGEPCTDSSQCPGGSCQNCDEFCHRTNQIIVDGTPVWEHVPWRDDCTPGSPFACQEWNSCGWPSCTFSRAGWCPGYIACHHDAPCDQDLDMTPDLAPGGTYDIDYNVLVNRGSWSVSLVAYWYEESTAFCGNNTREGTEVCDGSDLGGESCQTQGFDAGTLACQSNCDGFDTSGCRLFECGNTICETAAGEDCVSCPADCNGDQQGGGKYCCGDGDGQNPVPCSDPRCTAGGNTCE